MSGSVQSIKAGLRRDVGKGSSRAVRRDGHIPAVIYGGKEAPVAISLEARAFAPLARDPGFFSRLVEIDAEGRKIRAIPRDVQTDPVSDQPVHVDFLRVSANTRMRVAVPVRFTDQDKSPGLKRGGTLNIVQHQLLLICAPEKIPDAIPVSVDGLMIGDTIHLEDIKLPADVKPVLGGRADTTIASIAAPTTVKEEVAAPVAAAEGAAAPAEGAATPAAGAAPAAAAPAAKAEKKK